MNKSIAVIGSARRDGNTGKLVDLISRELDIEVIDLNTKNISPFDYKHKNYDDDFFPTIKHLLKYDNIIFASPVYWYSMSAQMKTFFDRLSDLLTIEKDLGRAFKGKRCSVLASGVDMDAPDCFIRPFKLSAHYL